MAKNQCFVSVILFAFPTFEKPKNKESCPKNEKQIIQNNVFVSYNIGQNKQNHTQQIKINSRYIFKRRKIHCLLFKKTIHEFIFVKNL